MSDDFEPAIDGTAPEREASDTTEHERHEGAAAPPPETRRGDDPNNPPADATSRSRAPREISDKTRAMFRDVVKKMQAGEIAAEDELVPVDHSTPSAPPAAPAVVQPAAAAPVQPQVPDGASQASKEAAAIPAPPPGPVPRAAAPPPGLPAIPQSDSRSAELDQREAKLKEREAAIDQREKKLPTRERMLENAVPTLAEYLKDVYGITSDDELKDTLTDLMTEMSETYHGVKLPDEIKARVDGRKALRTVKAVRATVDRERAELAEREKAVQKRADEEKQKAEVADYERQAVSQLGTLLPPVEAQYPYLAIQENSPAIVWEVIKAAHDQGHKIDWVAAAKYANEYYKKDYEDSQAAGAKRAARLQSLLAPASAAKPAPAQSAASPSGAPGPAPTPPAQAKPAPPPPAPPTAPSADDELVGEDRRERRARTLRGLISRHGLNSHSQ